MKKIIFILLLISSSLFGLDLDIWTVSQCPYCIMLEKSLFEAIDLLGNDKPNIKWHYFMQLSEDGQIIKSMHGPNEKAENIRQAIIQERWPEKLEIYMRLRSTHYRDSLWQKDATIAGLDTVALDSLAELLGDMIVLDDAVKGAELGIRGTPTIFVDGKQFDKFPRDAASIYMAIKNSKATDDYDTECFDKSDCVLYMKNIECDCIQNICVPGS